MPVIIIAPKLIFTMNVVLTVFLIGKSFINKKRREKLRMESATKKMTPLTEEERNAFTVAYRFYERWHDIEGTEQEWLALCEDIMRMPPGDRENDLLQQLVGFLICYLSDKTKRTEDEERNKPEQQVMMLDGRAVAV